MDSPKAFELVGGRYDGMPFLAFGDPSVIVLECDRERDGGEPPVTGNLGQVRFVLYNSWPESLAKRSPGCCEIYVRCPDGYYRTPPLTVGR